jgi:hypothetical protein
MANNPLQQYFRQPKIYIKLPSQGVYNQQGSIQGDTSNLPVYGMTGMDEIIVRTPDALFNGDATVKLIESCCPSIKNPWDLSTLDTNLLFTAIRIATYGSTMTVTHVCDKCNTPSDYELDLNRIVDHFNTCSFENKVVLKELTVRIKPLTYKQQTEYNLEMYDLRKRIMQADLLPEGEERTAMIADMWRQISTATAGYQLNSIDAVETPTVTVVERVHINEWLSNCEKTITDAIKDQVDKNQASWKIPAFPAECTNAECKAEVNLTVDLDNSNFFVTA